MHIVRFDADGKIRQIRLYWDQASLLKQVEVMGARARGWPIRDGKDQAKLIVTSAANVGPATSAPPSVSAVPTATNGKPRAQSTHVTRDPHASLSGFGPSEDGSDGPKAIAPKAAASGKPPLRDYNDLFMGGNESETTSTTKKGAPSSPTKENSGFKHPPPKAQTSKPAPRDYHELFVGNESDNSPVTRAKLSSPEKDNLSPGSVAPKFGAGKNYKPNRLFDQGGDAEGMPPSPTKSAYKPHPNRYNHFDFDHGEEAPGSTVPRPKTKHQSQWDFEDFSTPIKPSNKVREHDRRHFEIEQDTATKNVPAKTAGGINARSGFDPHFELQDDGTPAGNRRPAGQPRGAGTVRSTGLYQHHDLGDDTPPNPDKSKPLATVTNLQDRRKDFDSHFSMMDSPAESGNKAVPEVHQKMVSQMGAQWDAADDSPASTRPSNATNGGSAVLSNKENVGAGRPMSFAGIKSGGDGMGGKKGASKRWGIGDDSDIEEEQFRPGKRSQAPKSEELWDF